MKKTKTINPTNPNSMKKSVITRLSVMVFLSALVFACSDDKNETPKELTPKLDGFYVYGTNTIAAASTEPTARMSRAVLDPGKGAQVNDMEGVYGKFMYIGANSSLKFAEVKSEKGVIYGAEGGGATDSASVVGNVIEKDVVIHGTLKADATPINIKDEGLYYVFVNTNTGLFIIMRVKADMIGDATEPQWSRGTLLPQKSTSKDSTVFEKTELNLKGSSGYRYRFNDGWHVYNDNTSIATLSSLGVASYGDAWASGVNDLGFFLDNIPHKEDGVWTIRLKFDAATGTWTEKKIKTGNLLKDYTSTQMGLFGNAYVKQNGDTANWGSGTDGYDLKVPAKVNKVYTWTWTNVNLIEGREFIFLEGGAWGGLQIDATGATNTGSAIDNSKIVDATTIGNQYHNYYVKTGGSYDVTLVIDAVAATKTVTITPH
jgi:hypothetical protein